MFKLPCFMEEFINCGKLAHLLQRIPIHVITDYNVSLYGAAEYFLLESKSS
jgi:glucokinase